VALSLPAVGQGRLRLRSASVHTTAPDEAIVLFGLFVAALFGLLLAASVSLHILLALAVCPLVFAVVWMSPRSTILGLAFWLVALGMVRRLLGSGSSAGLGDPLLLVAPAVLALLFLVASGRGALRQRSRLANVIGLLSLLVLAEALNPFQAGFLVGLGGLLFMLVPMLAFWVGRSLLDDVTLRRLFRLVAVLAVVSALYGLFQQFVGFPSWDQRWITSSGYVALNIGNGVTRAFGNFASAQEYAAFLSVGLVVLVSDLRNVRRVLLPVALAAIGLVGCALVLASVRTSLVLAAAALGSIAAARVRLRPSVALVAGALAIVALGVGLSYISVSTQTTTSAAANPTGTLLQHDISGITNPTGSGSSLPGHLSETFDGIKSAFSQPIGYGSGSVTPASGRLGASTSNIGTESDLGNAGTGLGLLGFILYAVVVVIGLLCTYRLAVRRRDALAFASLGLLVVMLDQWLNGDLYSVAWLVWLSLGWVDRSVHSFPSESVPSLIREEEQPQRNIA
jgi:hypothetical protein